MGLWAHRPRDVTRTSLRILSRIRSVSHMYLTSSERSSREFRSIFAVRESELLMMFTSIRIIPAKKRLLILTEIIVICLSKELQQRTALSVVSTSSVAILGRSNGDHTSI